MPLPEQPGTFLLSSEIRQTMMDLLTSADEMMKDDPECAHRCLDRLAEFLSPALAIEIIQ